jgi:hypothetical protein
MGRSRRAREEAAGGSGGFVPAPTFTSITPDNGPALTATPFAIVGNNFLTIDPATGVQVGAEPATGVVIVDDQHLTGVTPADIAAGAVDVVLTNPHGSITAPGAFTFT